jgi:transcriptional regulator with XRE-family HTH domain
MAEGWDAAGRLEPLWGRVGGRDKLAKLTGIQPGTLSSYNSGKRGLGEKNARRIAAVLKVSIFDLGAPEAAASTRRERRVVDRLREVEAALEALGPDLAELANRVSSLERPGQPRTRGGTTR